MFTWIRHNQGMFVALLLSGILLVWTYGCNSTVTSLIKPETKVTRSELAFELDQEARRLEAELDALQKSAALKFADLDRQDEIKRKLFEFAAVTSKSADFNPAGLFTLVGSILGLGAVIDNRIKDKVIKNRPLPTTEKS